VSAVDDGHVAFFVAFAGGRGEHVEPFDLSGGQLDAVGGGVLLNPGDPFGAGDRGDVVALREQPGQSGLCRGGAPASVATASTSSTMRRLRWKFSPVKRGLVRRQSSSASCSVERILPVRKPWPSGE